MTIAFWY